VFNLTPSYFRFFFPPYPPRFKLNSFFPPALPMGVCGLSYNFLSLPPKVGRLRGASAPLLFILPLPLEGKGDKGGWGAKKQELA